MAFGIGTQVLVAAQGLVVARILGPEVMGVYALATGGVAIGATLKQLGIPQKLVQEREEDLVHAYSVAFTLELLLATSVLVVVAGGVGPLLAFAYHRPDLWPVTAALALSLLSVAFLQLPAALPYRDMRFLRRNAILAVGPVVTFPVTVGAAVAGLGVWSLVAGNLAGTAAAAVVVLVVGPLRPRLRWDRRTVRRFVGFGAPLWGAGVLGTAMGWVSAVAVSATVGVAGLGLFNLAQNWASQATVIDGYLSDTLFPALCSIQDSVDRQRRAFVASTRLAMAWAAPVGLGMVVFAQPVLALVLGPHWARAVILVRAEGAAVLVNCIAYSWNMFYAARGDTRPQFVSSLLGAAWLAVVVVPLLVVWGLAGAAASLIVLAAGSYLLRRHYLARLFGKVRLVSMVWRELASAGLAAAVLTAARFGGWRATSLAVLAAQIAVYLVVAGGAFLVLERRLVAEVAAGLRLSAEGQTGGDGHGGGVGLVGAGEPGGGRPGQQVELPDGAAV